MGFELPLYWEQIREESADDLKEYNENFADYLLDKRINLLSTRYNGFDLLFDKFDIYTTRFNSYTYLENQRYKENKMHGFSGALYSTTLPFPANTSDEKYLFVLDMNNTTNKLLGVSFLKNKLAKDQNINIYADPSFNNCIYKLNVSVFQFIKLYCFYIGVCFSSWVYHSGPIRLVKSFFCICYSNSLKLTSTKFYPFFSNIFIIAP